MGNVIRNRSLMWRINMDKIIINGGNRLTGEVQVEGAKMLYYLSLQHRY